MKHRDALSLPFPWFPSRHLVRLTGMTRGGHNEGMKGEHHAETRTAEYLQFGHDS